MFRKAFLFLFILATLGLGSTLHAQQPSFEQQIESWLSRLDAVEEEIARGDLTAERIEQLRSIAQTIQADAREARAEAEAQLATPQRELEALGPDPSAESAGEEGAGEGEAPAPESASVASRRANLQEQVTLYQGEIKEADLVISRAQEILRELSALSGQRFTQELFARGPSPLSLQTWTIAVEESRAVATDLLVSPIDWWRAFGPHAKGWAPWGASLLIGLVVAAVLLLLRRWLMGRYGRKVDIESPSFSRRALAAAVDGLTGGLAPSMALVAFASLLERQELASQEAAPLLYGLGWGMITYWVISQIVRAVFAPKAPQWRLVPFSSEISRLLGLQLQGFTLYLAIVTALFVAIRGDGGVEALDPNFRACFMLIINSLTAFFLSFLLGSWLWRRESLAARAPSDEETAGQESSQEPTQEAGESAAVLPPSARLARLLIGVILFAMPVTALFGYTMLSTYIASRLIQLSALFGVTFILLAVLTEGLQALFAPASGMPGPAAKAMGMTRAGGERTVFWLKLLLQGAVLIYLLLVVLLIVGIPESSLSLWISEFLQGVTIGGFTFSPGGIIVGVGLFVVGIFLTRLITRFLGENLLPKTRMDLGVRHSLTAAANYAGIILAAMIGISALGLDLSNLAIIAGALSVGIGFGLREVVNNFVSGLLLLIERPIKVGDWVEVAGYHGTVKRISVRSTEIQTFDRSEVIVPNSELIAGSVVNWTHRTRIARTIIPVGVAYGSDTEQVKEILLQIARDHQDILDVPAPAVYFMEFGDSSLNFELRAYLRDTDYVLTAPSEMRFAIDKAFREAGVEIPFPQRDINFRTELHTAEGPLKPSAPAELSDDVTDSGPPQKESPGAEGENS